jgi:hypothetical protein
MIRKFNETYIRPLSGLTQSGNLSLFSTSPSNVIANHLPVSANQFNTGDVIRIRSHWTKSGSTDSTTLRLWFNTSLSTSGATDLGYISMSGGRLQILFSRRLCFFSSSTAVGMSSFDTSHGDGPVSTSIQTYSITNWLSSSGFFFMTYSTTNSKVVDNVNCLYISIEI